MHDRLSQWQFAAPCDLSLYVPDAENMTSDDIRTGIEAAIRQIAPSLPQGSRVHVYPRHDVYYTFDMRAIAAGAAAVAAVAPAVPHVAVLPVVMPGGVETFTRLLHQQSPESHVALFELHVGTPGTYAEVSDKNFIRTHAHTHAHTHTHTHTHHHIIPSSRQPTRG